MPIYALRRNVIFVSLILGSATCAIQQGHGEAATNARIRNECRQAAQIIRTGRPAPRLTWAAERIPECTDVGPAALGTRWRMISGNADDLEALTLATMRVRDGALYSALLAVAASRSRPPQVRVAAMLALAKLTNPGIGIPLNFLEPPDTIRWIPMAAGSTTHSPYALGPIPMPLGFRRQVLALLEQLTADRAGQPREVWYAAGMLAQRVRADLEREPEQ
jgi:hypothetical protein